MDQSISAPMLAAKRSVDVAPEVNVRNPLHAGNEVHEQGNPPWLRNQMADITGFPLGLENLEKWEGIFRSGKSQGILNRLEKSGKITQNTGKLKEFEIDII